MRVVWLGWITAITLLVASLCGCSSGAINVAQGQKMTGGDAAAGKQALLLHDCHSCHEIPGIEGDKNLQGPPLERWATRKTIAKEWPNSPANLENWIRHSEQLRPGTSMKLMNVSEKDARDIAAYLFSLN